MTVQIEHPTARAQSAISKPLDRAVFFGASLVLVAMIVAVLVGLTDRRDAAIDDAYITYIYGQNLADGHGLRYNISDAAPTEGSSSLLHVMLVAVGTHFEIDPLTLTRGLSVLGFAAFVVTMAFMAGRLADVGRSVALPAAVATGFGLLLITETVGHMSAGMDTTLMFVLHGAFFCWTLTFAFASKGSGAGFIGMGLILGIALMLIRPEGFVLAFAMIAAAFTARLLAHDDQRAGWVLRDISPVFVGLTGFLIGYFAWKISYFGDILPTAYWVKSNNNIFGSDGALLPGLKHVISFLIFRWIPLAIVAFALVWSAGGRRLTLISAVLLLPSVAVVLLYSRAIHEVTGGFRYGYPLTAPLFVLAALGLAYHIKRHAIVAPTAILVGMFAYVLTAQSPDSRVIQSLKDPRFAVAGWMNHQPDLVGLSPVARDLKASGLASKATILTSAAGIIPFQSGFTAVDWLGLNDEQLSGKYEMTAEEVRAYIGSKHPDLAMSIFPAATSGAASYTEDPGFNSNSVKATLAGRGVKLFKHWDLDRVSDVIWSQMVYLRDSTDFAMCYPLIRNWAIFVYVDRASPHYDRLMETFRNSKEAKCDPERIKRMYNMELIQPVELAHSSDG